MRGPRGRSARGPPPTALTDDIRGIHAGSSGTSRLAYAHIYDWLDETLAAVK